MGGWWSNSNYFVSDSEPQTFDSNPAEGSPRQYFMRLTIQIASATSHAFGAANDASTLLFDQVVHCAATGNHRQDVRLIRDFNVEDVWSLVSDHLFQCLSKVALFPDR